MSAAADPAYSAPSENVEIVRRRARHRLLGAVVLVFVAVVAFPLLFDAQPRPVPVNTPIVIADRSTAPAFNSNAPVAESQRPAPPLLPSSPVASSNAVPAPASVEPGREQVLPATEAPKTEHNVEHKVEHKAATPPAAAHEGKEVKVEKKSDSKTDSKNHTPSPAKPDASDQGRWVIQAGAYAEADKLCEVRRKLESAGLKTYTQVIEGKDGKRSTRVRIGPFGSRTEADKAAARIRKLDLPAHILAL